MVNVAASVVDGKVPESSPVRLVKAHRQRVVFTEEES